MLCLRIETPDLDARNAGAMSQIVPVLPDLNSVIRALRQSHRYLRMSTPRRLLACVLGLAAIPILAPAALRII